VLAGRDCVAASANAKHGENLGGSDQERAKKNLKKINMQDWGSLHQKEGTRTKETKGNKQKKKDAPV